MKKLFIALTAILITASLVAQEANNDPLVIVNGVQTNLKVNNLDPNTIESVNVLKGESATAIYGPAGKDGVIQIRTKGGDKTDLLRINDKEPLIIVDGKEYDSDINSIDANSIKVISVHKTGPVTDQYGEKGKNGVIIITTKK